VGLIERGWAAGGNVPNVQITLEELNSSYNWAEVFADYGSGNTSKDTSPALPDMKVDCTPPCRGDVVQIIAAVNGERDGDAWVGLFLLRDGRFLVARGSCDYTGWDCQAGNSLTVAPSLSEAIRFGMGNSDRDRLGLSLE
jgi:hypothetical protein